MSDAPERRSVTVIAYATRAERIEVAMHKLMAPIPSTKGMNPRDRANRLHTELERRIAVAVDALRYVPGERSDNQPAGHPGPAK